MPEFWIIPAIVKKNEVLLDKLGPGKFFRWGIEGHMPVYQYIYRTEFSVAIFDPWSNELTLRPYDNSVFKGPVLVTGIDIISPEEVIRRYGHQLR